MQRAEGHFGKSWRSEEERGGQSDAAACGFYRESSPPVYTSQGQNCKSVGYLLV